jgi:predicted ATPase
MLRAVRERHFKKIEIIILKGGEGCEPSFVIEEEDEFAIAARTSRRLVEYEADDSKTITIPWANIIAYLLSYFVLVFLFILIIVA